MKRTIGLMVGVGLALSACGGGDGEAGDGQSPIGAGGSAGSASGGAAGSAAGVGGAGGSGDSGGAAGAVGDCTTPVTGDAHFDAVVTLMRDWLEAHDVSGGAVAVFDHGKLRTATIGSKVSGECSPITETTLFRVPYIARAVTAAAVLGAVNDGEISLDDPVEKYLPELSYTPFPGADPMTVHHLLTQSSGLPPGDHCHDLEKMSSSSMPYGPAWSAPGELFNMNAPDDQLAGLVLQRATKKSYGDAVREKLFEPLGIDATFDAAEAASRDNTAGRKNGQVQPIDASDCESQQPSKQMFASIADLGKLLQFFATQGKGVLPADLGARLIEPQGVHYADSGSSYGLWREGNNGHATFVVAYDGGFVADLVVNEGWDFGIALVWNSQVWDDSAILADQAFEEYTGEVSTAPMAPPDVSTYQSLVGTYVDDIGFGSLASRTAVVTAHDGKLFSNVDDLGERELVPVWYADTFQMNFGVSGAAATFPVFFRRDTKGNGSVISNGWNWFDSAGPPFRRVP